MHYAYNDDMVHNYNARFDSYLKKKFKRLVLFYLPFLVLCETIVYIALISLSNSFQFDSNYVFLWLYSIIIFILTYFTSILIIFARFYFVHFDYNIISDNFIINCISSIISLKFISYLSIYFISINSFLLPFSLPIISIFYLSFFFTINHTIFDLDIPNSIISIKYNMVLKCLILSLPSFLIPSLSFIPSFLAFFHLEIINYLFISKLIIINPIPFSNNIKTINNGLLSSSSELSKISAYNDLLYYSNQYHHNDNIAISINQCINYLNISYDLILLNFNSKIPERVIPNAILFKLIIKILTNFLKINIELRNIKFIKIYLNLILIKYKNLIIILNDWQQKDNIESTYFNELFDLLILYFLELTDLCDYEKAYLQSSGINIDREVLELRI